MSIEKSRILAELSEFGGNRRIRNWFIGGTAAFSLLTVVTTFAYVPRAVEHDSTVQTAVEQISQPVVSITANADEIFAREERIRPGDNLSTVIRRLGVFDPQADTFLRTDSVARVVQSRLRTGQLVSAQFDASGELRGLIYPYAGSERGVVIERGAQGFVARESALPLDTRVQTRSGVIRSSLFAAADEINLPDAVATQLAEIFGGEIDFHTDLRRGDRFSVVYESYAHRGLEVKTGRILAAELVNAGVRHRAVWFDGGASGTGYYSPDGQSLKKAFLRSPLEYSRVSSGFSMRMHPILNEWRAHKGVDYAAPTGTHVQATADGVVEFIGQQRGYGNFIVLRHHGQYTTAYGHLNGFAAGLRQGSRVAQGDVIGYVGRTGWATGPHLHYEFRVADVQRDPLSVDLPVAQPLSTAQLQAFKVAVQPMLTRFELISGLKTASAD